jgi:hypothetical protein
MHTKPVSDYLIKKASGEQVYFEGNKLVESLIRSGAKETLARQISQAISLELFDGITTSAIYSKAYQLLLKQESKTAINYRLKQAIMQLGPSGYPFEHFVGELFKARGFSVEVGKLVDGYSVRHEIDVLATNPHKNIFVECKFHNYQGTKTNVKVPMYIRSRFDDLSRIRKQNEQTNNAKDEGWIITNTRFTDDAVKFGRDYGLTLLSWDYPNKSSLKDWVELENLHPITCLSSLKQKEKRALLDKGIVLVRELKKQITNGEELPICPRNKSNCLKEIQSLIE